jgi:hypothetical protein
MSGRRCRVGDQDGLDPLEPFRGEIDVEAEPIGREVERRAAAHRRMEVGEDRAGIHLIKLRLGQLQDQRVVPEPAIVNVVCRQVIDRNIDRRIVSVVAEQEIGTRSTIDNVVAVAAADAVVAAAPEDRVVPIAAVDGIVAARAEERIVGVGSGDAQGAALLVDDCRSYQVRSNDV